MTIAELIEELKTYDQNKEVVVVGCSWAGSSEPEFFDSEPFIMEEETKVVIRT